MHRSAYSGVSAARSRVPEVKATEAGQKLPTISCPNPLRLVRDFAHSRREYGRVTALAMGAPSFEAGGEDPTEIRLRWSRQAKARHGVER
jgi:hypothetical protein